MVVSSVNGVTFGNSYDNKVKKPSLKRVFSPRTAVTAGGQEIKKASVLKRVMLWGTMLVAGFGAKSCIDPIVPDVPRKNLSPLQETLAAWGDSLGIYDSKLKGIKTLTAISYHDGVNFYNKDLKVLPETTPDTIRFSEDLYSPSTGSSRGTNLGKIYKNGEKVNIEYSHLGDIKLDKPYVLEHSLKSVKEGLLQADEGKLPCLSIKPTAVKDSLSANFIGGDSHFIKILSMTFVDVR
jgi:hypothetical protein